MDSDSNVKWLDAKGNLSIVQCVDRFLDARKGQPASTEEIAAGILADDPPNSWRGKSFAQCVRSVNGAMKRATFRDASGRTVTRYMRVKLDAATRKQLGVAQ